MRNGLHAAVAEIVPLDNVEREHQADVLQWIASGLPLYRTAKPATPSKHLVAYCVLVDEVCRSALLVDHRDAGLWLATGGHVDVDEEPAAAACREIREELGLQPAFVQGLEDRPLFVTCTVTQGVSAGHTDVSLWYVFRWSETDQLRPDLEEFAEARWWRLDSIKHGPLTRFDQNLPRFVAKLSSHWD